MFSLACPAGPTVSGDQRLSSRGAACVEVSDPRREEEPGLVTVVLVVRHRSRAVGQDHSIGCRPHPYRARSGQAKIWNDRGVEPGLGDVGEQRPPCPAAFPATRSGCRLPPVQHRIGWCGSHERGRGGASELDLVPDPRVGVAPFPDELMKIDPCWRCWPTSMAYSSSAKQEEWRLFSICFEGSDASCDWWRRREQRTSESSPWSVTSMIVPVRERTTTPATVVFAKKL